MRDRKQELLDELDFLLGDDENGNLEDLNGIEDLDHYLEEETIADDVENIEMVQPSQLQQEDIKDVTEADDMLTSVQQEVQEDLIHVENRDVSYQDLKEDAHVQDFDGEIIDLDKEYESEEPKSKGKNNKNYWIYGTILGVLVIVLVVVLASGLGSNSNVTTEKTEKDETQSQETEPITENNNPLKMNEYEDVKTLIQTYYKAVTDCDLDTLTKVVDDVSGFSQENLSKQKEYIESYDNIETYVKNGMTENAYVVWVYYETKLLNIDTSAPGSSVLYVERNADDNSLRIVNTSKDKKITEYMQQLMKDEDVVNFNKNVNLKLEQACALDKDLEQFVNKINGEEETSNQKTEE